VTSHASRVRQPIRVDPDLQVWSDLLKYMRQTQPDICRQWFDQLEVLGIAGGVLRVRAHTTMHRDFLNRACNRPFNEAAQVATGHLLTVKFLGPGEDIEPSARESATDAAKPKADANHAVGLRSVEVKQPLGHAGASSQSATASPTQSPGSMRGAGSESSLPSEAEMLAEYLPKGGLAAPEGFDRPSPIAASQVDSLYDDKLWYNPDYAFDNFIVGPGNRLAHAAALAVAANPGRSYNPFFVHGSVGLGKTHLLQAVCWAIKASNPNAVIYYCSCEGFITQFMHAVQTVTMNQFRAKFRNVDVLVIDDIHFLAKREKSQEEFFHTFNSLHQAHKQIILSSDAEPREIPDLEERLVSRFNMGLVALMSPPEFETRFEIVRNKARLRGLELPDDVAKEIARRIESNVRELEGAVVKLQLAANMEKRPVDMGLLRMALGDMPVRGEPTIGIQTIINAVTEFFGVKQLELQSKRRQRSIALPRQVCMYLARKLTRFSLEEIGGHFGGRDHTTVMHAVKTITDKCAVDSDFREKITALENRLRGVMGG
jgi:chromosomal replication initiator protein